MLNLSLVVPCYNEEAVLPEAARRLTKLLEGLIAAREIAPQSGIYFVDDGSTDRTWRVIEALAQKSELVRGIKLSRNRGHQNALIAGLFAADGDAVISVDADLQDDLDAVAKMLHAHISGSDIVYGVRQKRDKDTLFKRLTATLYYRLLAAMGVELVFNHADYRLLSRRAIEAMRRFREVNLFLRGIIPQLGFPSSIVYYDRAERLAGESKYPLKKMLGLAIQGITSFSAMPLRAITFFGIAVSAASFLMALWVLWVGLFSDRAVPGWASTALPIYFLGGLQLLSLGIIGEYLAKVYMESKRRPRYIIEQTIGAAGAAAHHSSFGAREDVSDPARHLVDSPSNLRRPPLTRTRHSSDER